MNILSLKNQIKKVVCGSNFSVCLGIDGRLRSWGSNYYLCLGVPNIDTSRVLVDISGEHFQDKALPEPDPFIVDISCGMQHCLALTAKGSF